ncbi:MAG TPA: hypothetical protein VJI32_07900 [Candidatus Nanoarchaeia archaeon]|nr:hypothetical protein [Candidatus Nanoarchaeia archaeon]
MLDEKRIEEIKRKVPRMLQEKEINKNEENKKFVSFYLNNALISLKAAKIIWEVSSQQALKKNFTFIDDSFEAYLWVINPSYYSMFYMAGALLASEGIKIHSEIGVHKKTFEAFVYYFYLTNKLPKYFVELFEQAQQESMELLGKEELLESMKTKTAELVKSYAYEMGKRSAFTYEIGETAKHQKAETSLQRAQKFYTELKKVLNI